MIAPPLHPAPHSVSPHSSFHGHIEYFSNGILSGWAYDPRPDSQPVRLHILIDRQEVVQIICDQPRADVKNALGASHNRLGFSYCLPEAFLDRKPHYIALRFEDRSILPFPDPDKPGTFIETGIFPGIIKPEYRSFVDGIDGDILRGWIVKRLTPHKPWKGNLVVEVRVDGRILQTIRANFYRSDVAQSLGCDPACGFEIILPRQLRDQQSHCFELGLIPDKVALEGSPLTTTLVDDALESRLIALEEMIGTMHRQMTTLRREVHQLIPRRPFNLRHYDRWARLYYQNLRRETARHRLSERDIMRGSKSLPLVSVICPVWRPLEHDFREAVGSVLGQTWQNWELILIDDGGQCLETTALIREFCREDPRIHAITLPQNGGISAATNAGIMAAKGTYIAFFDHDDLLVDVALEVMMRTALKTGAKLLYSDEDKIDGAGNFLEPNLKPDYNYRYLLGCNYICHLTIIERETLETVGLLNTRYDGAQDHDLLLRLVEVLPQNDIVHIPEILYHWRKTENSTAATINNKNYAVQAGTECVAAHLKRQNIAARVKAIGHMTLYAPHWQIKERPPVSIIIPFRDEYETTRRCVEDLLETQDYPDFELILVNNFSTTQKTLDYLTILADEPRVRILTVEEKFNYARLNNLAVQKSRNAFLLFLNNDVFIRQKDFLTLMIKEALSTPQTAIVGARLLYPNKTVQHAGVAVGPDVIGVHVHRAQPGKDYGYIGRIRLSHEVTAVTGAAMLVRRNVFEELGGFDEENLAIAYNDVDLCLKTRLAGWRIVYCAEAVAEHHESLSRGSDDRPEHEARFFHETQTMRERWQDTDIFRRDPAWPQAFTRERQTFFDLRNPDSLWYNEDVIPTL